MTFTFTFPPKKDYFFSPGHLFFWRSVEQGNGKGFIVQIAASPSEGMDGV